MSQRQILEILHEKEYLTSKEIANRLNQEWSLVTQKLRRLTKFGFVNYDIIEEKGVQRRIYFLLK